MLLASSPTSLAAAIEARSTNTNRDDRPNSRSSRFGRLINALTPADAFELEIAGRIVHNHIELDELTQSTSARLVAGDLARDSKEFTSLVKLEVHLERMLAASLRDLRTLRSIRGRSARGSTPDIHDEHSPLDLSSKSSIAIDHPAKEAEAEAEAEVDVDPIASSSADFAASVIIKPAATDLAAEGKNSQLDNESACNNQRMTESIVSCSATPLGAFNVPGSHGAGLIESSRPRSDRSDRSDRKSAGRSSSRVSRAAEPANRREKKRDRRSKGASRSTIKPSVSDWFALRRVDSFRDELFRGAPSGARPGSFLAANSSIFAEPFDRLDGAFHGFVAVSAS